nr:bud site selection protein bud4 [Quercus suber]
MTGSIIASLLLTPHLCQVQPLRIAKTGMTPASSPSKPVARPLSEIGSTSQRRNSPSYNQATKKMIVSGDTSPYTENPPPKASPHDFWSTRDPMSPSRFNDSVSERSPSPSLLSPKRRASIEKLRQAGRVKTSNIFALETKDAYDPAHTPIVERPSANRPLSQQLANNSFARFDSVKKENNPLRSPQGSAHKRNKTELSMSTSSPTKSPMDGAPHLVFSDRHESPSPTKSSLARNSQFGNTTTTLFDPESGTWSDEEHTASSRNFHRHAKSVTFQADPPVVTEYEQQTPEPSVSVASDREGSWDSDDFYDQDISFERGSSADVEREDSFDEDLENTDKTPVVLPEDWSRMSPDEARTDLIDDEDDVFDSPQQRPILGRAESVTSDGEMRPLPPLPGFTNDEKRWNSSSLRSAGGNKRTSYPKRASCSKEDILRMTRESDLSAHDRLHWTSGHGKGLDRANSHSSEETEHGQPEEFTVKNLDTGEKLEVQVHVADSEVQDESVVDELTDFAAPQHISRESILRKVRNTKYDFEDDDEIDASQVGMDETGRPTIAELARMDPDQPVPSRENSRENSKDYRPQHPHVAAPTEELVQVKEEPAEDDITDMASIPAISDPRIPSSNDHDYERQSSVLHHRIRSESMEEDDDVTHHSDTSSLGPEAESTLLHAQPAASEPEDGKETLDDAMQLLSVKDYTEAQERAGTVGTSDDDFTGLPEYLSTQEYNFGMDQYLTPSPQGSSEITKSKDSTIVPELQPPIIFAKPHEIVQAPYIEREVSPPGTPESVIHRDSDVSDISSLRESEATPPPPPMEIPERRATIKTGGKLKARPSGTPADLRMMADQRELISAEHDVPPIPLAFQTGFEASDDGSVYSSQSERSKTDSFVQDKSTSEMQDKSTLNVFESTTIDLSLSIPALNPDSGDGLCLDAEFDKVIESQKRGYLTRESPKVVIASSRNFSGESDGTAKSDNSELKTTAPTDAETSPGKGSADQHLKTEPWNGHTRRKSLRNASAQKNTAYSREPAPPLPGQEGALHTVQEDLPSTTAAEMDENVPEGMERGRLFVKVVGVKDLDLPMPRNEPLSFQLTLDNGLHCVTTSNLDLRKTAPIGQEFELVVMDDLEFQLTLTTKLKPPPKVVTPMSSSPSKSTKAAKSGGLSRFLTSPKKRAEKERKAREDEEAEARRSQQETQRKRASIQPTAWDLLHELVNSTDGAFARAYVNLKSHESQCYGRPLAVGVPCYNEWALEDDAQVMNSVRSKRGANTGPIRRPPYVVGHLDLQLLYVPKPRTATDDMMPKSMSSAIREMSKAREVKEVVYESHLRPRLTAYHEHTHQKRAVINLAKASRLVDDKRTLVADPTQSPSKSGKGRRKSAFAEEDEGYQYVEEGFRIRFSNGETIDFYADSQAEKDAWMNVLAQVIGKPIPSDVHKGQRWSDMVLAREKLLGTSAVTPPTAGIEVRDFTKPLPPVARTVNDRQPVAKSAPNSPVKSALSSHPNHAPPTSSSKPRPQTPPMSERRGHRSRDAVKSMIF